jgi:hypothetical protein
MALAASDNAIKSAMNGTSQISAGRQRAFFFSGSARNTPFSVVSLGLGVESWLFGVLSGIVIIL